MSRLLKSASLFGIKRQFIFPTWIKRFFGSRVTCGIIELSTLDPVQRSMTSAQIIETSVRKKDDWYIKILFSQECILPT